MVIWDWGLWNPSLWTKRLALTLARSLSLSSPVHGRGWLRTAALVPLPAEHPPSLSFRWSHGARVWETACIPGLRSIAPFSVVVSRVTDVASVTSWPATPLLSFSPSFLSLRVVGGRVETPLRVLLPPEGAFGPPFWSILSLFFCGALAWSRLLNLVRSGLANLKTSYSKPQINKGSI